MLSDFINLIFPNQCRACGNNLVRGESIICTFCQFHLPKTNYHFIEENPVVKHFWGKVNVRNAAAYYYFHKGEKVQALIHALKYRGEKEVGTKIGEWYGHELKDVAAYAQSDFIVPVPLHKKRIRSRGYNQAELFGSGLSTALGIQLLNSTLVRTVATETQTKKHRYNRFENMKEVFRMLDPDSYINKTFLLVDDVITTGSTLSSCAEEILKIPGTKVNIVAMAYAHS